MAIREEVGAVVSHARLHDPWSIPHLVGKTGPRQNPPGVQNGFEARFATAATALFSTLVACGSSTGSSGDAIAPGTDAATVADASSGADAATVADASSSGTDATADAAQEAISGSDAGDDATPPDPPEESVEIPGSTGNGISKMALDTGELFLLRANGTVDYGGTTMDAEYGGFASGTDGTDSVGGVDVGVDFGLKTVRLAVPPVLGRMKWFGPYRTDHVYYVIVNGVGNPLSVKLLRPTLLAGSGGITVSIYRLSPTLHTVGMLVDTVAAPVTLTPTTSAVATTLGTVYLLQCDGQAHVGGNGLAKGDADWMDYADNGTGQVDIGDAKTDYGLGVDEPFVGMANSNTPRKRWWGLWRKDHIYYMLFAGTGNKIHFDYYDVGYGDNSATVTLAVRLWGLR